MTNDTFARETARHAHQRIHELADHITRLEKSMARRPGFAFRCHLCGDPCKPKTRYCHAHSWAEGGR